MLKADTTIAVSDFILSHIRQTYPTHHGRLIRIYRGINTRYFAPTEVNQDMREVLLSSWGLTLKPRKIILLPGRLTRLKGHHLFIEALAMLASSEIHAVIVGDLSGRTSYVEELKTYAESLGINTAGPQQQLHFVGACSDMPTAYSLADVVVSASTKPEAFGRTACEAQAMGKLVVATQHGGSCETLHPSQQAGMCAPGDAQSLSAALERQLAVPDKLRKEIASKSRQHIAANFSLENMCEQTIETYHQILARHTARQA